MAKQAIARRYDIAFAEYRSRLCALTASAQTCTIFRYICIHSTAYDIGTGPGLCPVAEAAYNRIITLPIFPAMDDRDIDQWIRVYHQSILEFSPESSWNLVFTKGVLIHLNPEMLTHVYDLLHKASNRYLLICEYYNPQPVEVQPAATLT